MITLYHSPQSRSTSILSLLRMMGKDTEVTTEIVEIKRTSGQGHADPRNPHPENKVPVLVVDGQLIRERGAIMLWLTDHFDSPLGRGNGSPGRGDYLSWLFYYGNVMEPVLYLTFLEIGENPMIHEWCRDTPAMFAAIEAALNKHAFLVDEQISAADILVASPFKWFPDIVPEKGPIKDWLARCEAAQDLAFIMDFENAALKKLGLPSLEEQQKEQA